jgi:hypothetical protein
MKWAQRAQEPVGSSLAGPSWAKFRRSLGRRTFRPKKPSRAGSRVREAVMVSTTTRAADRATPYRKATWRANMPSRAMQTVMPATKTARPDVSSARATESSTLAPCSRLLRWRVTMNRA